MDEAVSWGFRALVQRPVGTGLISEQTLFPSLLRSAEFVFANQALWDPRLQQGPQHDRFEAKHGAGGSEIN